MFAQVQGPQGELSGANEAHVLCMTEAPHAGSEQALAFWAWLRMHTALGLLESWAASEDPQVHAFPTYTIRNFAPGSRMWKLFLVVRHTEPGPTGHSSNPS